jgi:hypothetical protein
VLVPVSLSVLFGAAAEFGLRHYVDGGKVGIISALNATVATALKDPLALFAERSPGSRGSGVLQLTKSSAAPHERVLAQVREREPVVDSPSGLDTPAFPDNRTTIAPTSGALPSGSTNTQDGGSPNTAFNNTPLGFPGLPITSGVGGGGIGTSSSNPDGTDAPPSGPGGTDTLPSSPSGADTPPDGPGNVDTPPGNPGGTSGFTPPPVIAVPEPPTWALMILSLLSIFVIWRTDERKRAA